MSYPPVIQTNGKIRIFFPFHTMGLLFIAGIKMLAGQVRSAGFPLQESRLISGHRM
jgi:hypothetical protein